MKLSDALIALTLFALAVVPVSAQFIETPTDPPPSAKELDLPTIIETISELALVDDATPDGANGFIKDEAAAILLGKALFWDMQMGSDEVACATCHYHAGADNRDTNQVSPGLNGGNGVFDVQKGGKIGPNSKLLSKDFPFHELSNPADRDSIVVFDTDDVASSAGMFASDFNDIVPGNAIDDCTPVADPLQFHLGNGLHSRQVEPRNTPTIINAAFNHRNFWDGRANNIFNGVDGSGPRNPAARVLEVQGDTSVDQIQVAFENSSLASQAVVPPQASFETSCLGRIFPKIGKKLLSLQPLALQKVHPIDSVLGALRDNPRGLTVSYATLIQNAISDRFWDSDQLFYADKKPTGNSGTPANFDEYTLMEANFSLIWGLAIQAFERTQISDDAPFDQWAEAPGGRSPTVGNSKGILTDAQMRGMILFFTNELAPETKIGLRGNCSTCHQGPLFSTATFPFTEEEESGEFPEKEQLVERMRRGDGVNIAEDLFRYFISGQGTVGSYTIDGTAGALELPSISPATVGGDITLNGVDCKVESYLTNQDRTQPPPTPGVDPPEPPGPSDYADYSTKDAVIRVSGACVPFGPPISQFEIRIIDGGSNPNDDTAQILPVFFGGLPAPCPVCYPIPAAYGAPIASGIVVGGDFTIEVPTVYDTAFYNIGVRPTGEDPGVGANDSFGVPLSFTKQWIDQLLGTPGADVRALKSLNFARVTEPFSWYGDSVFFPGGFAGYAWLTHRLQPNPDFGNDRCTFQSPPFFPAPPPYTDADQPTCEAAGFRWFMPSQWRNTPYAPIAGRGDDAVPAYDADSNDANYDAILNMPKAIDGAFKVPNLRNVALTGPFFHNGGQGTLHQVVEFYNRGGDFAIENLGDLAPNIHPLDLDAQQIDDIVAFLDALTDERVRCKQAPFDHPEIILPEGHQTKDDGTGQAKDKTTIIDAVGAGGVSGKECIGPFL